jgi:hypothetical protein
VDKSSHYEYLATYVDDILIWSKDPMAVIKTLEKTYMRKSVGIPEYYLGGNVEFLGEAWKNHGLGLLYQQRPIFRMFSLNLKVFLAKSLSPSRHVRTSIWRNSFNLRYHSKNKNIF